MNVPLIILIIVILILVLYIVYYVGVSSQTLIDLSKVNAGILSDKITNPASSSFTYGMWVYVNSWSTSVKEIISAKTSDGTNKFRIYLDSASPTLMASIYTTDTSSPTKTITITNNFPVQRWVYIVISVEGTVVDCYLDGKLVKSQQLNYLPNMSGEYTISYGVFDAFLTKFSRISSPSDPQTVWNNYMVGNGYSSIGPNYGFSVTLTKDQEPIAKYQYL